MMRAREDILIEIHQSSTLCSIYKGWTPKEQEMFLNYCTGIKGQKLLYDVFFKRIFDPGQHPERLIDLLSCILNKKIISIEALSNDSSLIIEDHAAMIFDIIARLDDGSIVNIEIQKYGYKFPGQRASCYSSDLVLRQYQRAKAEDRSVSYKDLKNTYTIILMETSPKEFNSFPNTFLHHFSFLSDTGLALPLLQNCIFIPLDIFQNTVHNIPMSERNGLESWLTFLTAEDPEEIIQLIDAFPHFEPIYEEIYTICRNLEGIMPIFAEQLATLDRNTFRLMVDEFKEEEEKARKERDKALRELDKACMDRDQACMDRDQACMDRDQACMDRDQALADNAKMASALKAKDSVLRKKSNALCKKDKEIARLRALLSKKGINDL